MSVELITTVDQLTALPDGTVLLESHSITPMKRLTLPALAVVHDDYVETRWGLLAHDEVFEAYSSASLTVIYRPGARS